jgi:hypothetical protein
VNTATSRRLFLSPFLLGVIFAASAATVAAVSLFSAQRTMWRRHLVVEAEGLPWVVFLKDGADRSTVEETVKILPGVESLRFVSKDEALESAKADPAFAGGLTLTGTNPLPESFVVRWNPLFTRADLLDQHARRVAALPGVESVDYDRPRVERFALSQKAFSQLDLAWATATALVVALFLSLGGRLLFFASSETSLSALGADALAVVLGSGVGALTVLGMGLTPDVTGVLSGALAGGILAISFQA